MALTIRYQTTYEPFKVVDDIKDIPKDATIVWYDFDEPNEQENEWFKAHFSFNDLEVDDAINGMPRAKYKSYKDYQYLVFHSIMGVKLFTNSTKYFYTRQCISNISSSNVGIIK